MGNLKPCPFCGGEVCVCKISPNHVYTVVCYGCDLSFGFDEDYGGEFNTEEQAIAAWNRRVNDEQIH